MSESTATRMLKHLPCDSKQHACLSVCDHSYKCQSGQRNLTKSPHHSHTWTVQWHSPGGANVHPHPTPAFLGPTESILQTASRLIQPFLHSSWQKATILYYTIIGSHFHPKNCPCTRGSGRSLIYASLGSLQSSLQMESMIDSAVFAQLKAESPYTAQWAAPSPLKSVPSHWTI